MTGPGRHKARLIEECAACGKQHSLFAGTIFEQTKTGLAKWFLAIYLVTSSKGGISAMELKRQMGFGSYQTAWSWLHKIRQRHGPAGAGAADRAGRGRRDLRRRPAAGHAGARRRRQDQGRRCVESGRGQAQGAVWVGCAWPWWPTSRPSSLQGFLGQQRRPAGDRGDRRLVRLRRSRRRRLRATSRSISAPAGATPRCACRRSTWCSAWPSAGCSAPTTAPSPRSTCRPTSTSSCSASTAAPPRASPTASPASSSKASSPHPRPTTTSSPDRLLRLVES